MNANSETGIVSIQYSLAFDDSVLISNIGKRPFDYTPGKGEIFPIVEAALKGAIKGDKKRISLTPTPDPRFQLGITRLAQLLGLSGETLILTVEVL